MKTKRRVAIVLMLALLCSIPARADDESESPGVRMTVYISSPLDFIKSVDELVSTITAGTGEEVMPGATAMGMLTAFPVPVDSVNMDSPFVLLLLDGEPFESICAIFSVPDFDEFIASMETHSSAERVESESGDVWEIRLPGIGRMKAIPGDGGFVAIGSDEAAVRRVIELGDSFVVEQPEDGIVAVTVYEPGKFDFGGEIRKSAGIAHVKINEALPLVIDEISIMSFNSDMVAGGADLLHSLVDWGVREIEALKMVKLSAKFDRNFIDVVLDVQSDDGSLIALQTSAVSYLADGDNFEANLAERVPDNALVLNRIITLLRDPDFREKAEEVIGFAFEKLLPEKRDEVLDAFSQFYSMGGPAETVQAVFNRGGRDLVVTYIQVDDPEEYVSHLRSLAPIGADLVNSFIGEQRGAGLRVTLDKHPEHDYSVLRAEIDPDSKLSTLLDQEPPDKSGEFKSTLANIRHMIGSIGDVMVVVSGSTDPDDFAFAAGILDDGVDSLVVLSAAAAVLDRLPGYENTFFTIVDTRNILDLYVDILGQSTPEVDDQLAALKRSFIGDRAFVGASINGDYDVMTVRSSVPTPAVNAFARNTDKLWSLLRFGTFDED
ncbi:MAG: hypothetical protein LBJ46_10750 [Planctomycetota bacterium]|nr:hypothetical protein [Planctomycetota bacterium]